MTENIRHSSETAEHYSPPWVCELAREALGGIDLDPAACDVSNTMVRPDACFTKESNGYVRKWWGRTFLNPPGGKCDVDGAMLVKGADKKLRREDGRAITTTLSSQKQWWEKLAREWVEGRIKNAFFVGFSLEILQSTQVTQSRLPVPLDLPLFFPSRRVAYYTMHAGKLVEGSQPPHASVFVFLPEVGRFDESVARFNAAAHKSARGKALAPASLWQLEAELVKTVSALRVVG
jgi:hypothetical protein